MNYHWEGKAPARAEAMHASDEARSRAKGFRRLLHQIGMALLLGLFGQIVRRGTLEIIDPDNRAHTVGKGPPCVTARIRTWTSVWRIAAYPDMAIGEAYMEGLFLFEQGSTVYDFLQLCLGNSGLEKGHWVRRLHAFLHRLARRMAQYNPVRVARKNVAHHYDLSDELYSLFLDENRQYSCGYFCRSTDTLEQAQTQKMRHIAAKLCLSAGQKVLDIGSGWGGLAIYLARRGGVDVTGLTLSSAQHKYAAAKVDEIGLAQRVRFRLNDYRQHHEIYDRIVSVGMFEHVGVNHYAEFFGKIADLLSDDGVALIHTIGLSDGPAAAHPWIRKYIFPGGYSPALSEIVPEIERAGLYITDVEVLRLHYAETLKAWRARFLANRSRVVALYDERFARMWEFYLAGCEASFRYSGLVVFQLQLSKRLATVPLTREYIHESERQLSLEE